MLPEVFTKPWSIRRDVVDFLSTTENSSPQRSPVNGLTSKIINRKFVITVRGVLCEDPNIGAILGIPTTSPSALRSEIKNAINSQEAYAVLLCIDSPGGIVDNLSEILSMIVSAKKEVLSACFGQACGAAFWLGATCLLNYANDTTQVGANAVYSLKRSSDIKSRNSGVYDQVARGAYLGKRPAKDTDFYGNETNGLIDSLYTLFVETLSQKRAIKPEDIVVAAENVFLAKDNPKLISSAMDCNDLMFKLGLDPSEIDALMI